MDLALASSFRQIPRVRCLGFLVLVYLASLASVASAAPASDPAFLGVSMDDAPGFCSIRDTTPASPAEEAGMAFGDAVYSIDGVPLAGPTPCTKLTSEIVARRPGDEIKLDVRRGSQRVTIKATLSTRGEVLHRRFVGAPMQRIDLVDLDNDNVSYDLGDRGRTTIVGWFALERCTNCGRVFDRIADELRTRLRDAENPPGVLAVTAAPLDKRSSLRKSFTANVTLASTERDVFEDFALRDSVRISFMVIDCRGVVRFVAPIAPDADDFEAAVDDLLAAAEQAEYLRTRRL